jgi:DNA invertase Pin-like site-specific DNA recombinase
MSEKRLSREEKRALIAKVITDCKDIAERYVNDWKPVDATWSTIEGAAYLRLSTDQQVMVEKGSLEQQVNIAASEAEIKSRENKINYRIVRYFIEPGITGKSDKRPEFSLMREGISKGLYRFIVTKELSRIARDNSIWHAFMDTCLKMNCELVVRNLRINPRDPTQRIMFDQLASMASFESALTSKRQMESNHTRLIVSKRLNSTHPILGLDQRTQNGLPITGAYQKNFEEAKLAKWIFETMLATESEAVTLRKIEQKGIKNKNRTFTKGTLHSYLTNIKLIAKMERNKANRDKGDAERSLMPYERYALVDLDYEPVIPTDLWEGVQKIIGRNAKQLHKNTKLKKIYLLHGLLRLPDGTTFHGTGANGNGGRKSYYFNRATKLRIDADDVEHEAANAVVRIIKDSEKLLNVIQRHSKSQTRKDLLRGQTQRMKDLLHGLKSEKDRAALKFETLLAEGSKDKRGQYTKEYESTVERIDTETSKLQAQIDTLERSRSVGGDDFFGEFKERLIVAQKMQDLITRKADPVMVKAAYRKLFRAVIAEPCLNTGTFKLKFIIGDNGGSDTNGEQGSVMEEVVGPPGLEPGIRRL